MTIEELIQDLRKQLYSKAIPGKLLNNIMDKKLKEFAPRCEHDPVALWIGSYLADLFIVEAREQTGNHMEHVPMAAKYAREEIFSNCDLTDEQQEIILEIVETHHGGEQKHIESKLFTNADAFKFLEPEGVFHLFGAYYQRTDQDFEATMQNVMFKVDEKFHLVDLDEETKREAKELYDRWQYFFERTGVEFKVPEIYKKK